MKKGLNFILFCMLTGCVYNTSTAQISVVAKDSLFVKEELNFPPLEVLLDSALKHNALVNFRKLEITGKESNLASQRNNWLRNLGMQGDARYGTIDAFSTNVNGVYSNSLNTSTKLVNYAAGVYFKIPIFDIVNRKTQIRQAKAELEQAKYMVKAQEDELRQMVIRQYQDLLLKQKLLVIKSQNLGSGSVNIEMVEKQFRNGTIPLMEYVRISDMNARIQTDYEMAKSEFLVSKQILEELVGFSLNSKSTSIYPNTYSSSSLKQK
jgi:outer membrane protein TolC